MIFSITCERKDYICISLMRMHNYSRKNCEAKYELYFINSLDIEKGWTYWNGPIVPSRYLCPS